MERLRRLTRLWSYLPAFRAVAETEHLPRASEQLRVSPSALSRAIRLMEEDVGVALFDRVGRNLELNPNGKKLLSAVRDSMRLLDEGLAQVAGAHLAGEVWVGAEPYWLGKAVLPALESVRASSPALIPVCTHVGPEVAGPRLLRGQLDVVVVSRVLSHDDLTVHRLVDLSGGVYCGSSHPAYEEACPDLVAYPFAAPEQSEHDPWPPEIARQVDFRGDLQTVLSLCERGQLLAVLPDLVAKDCPGMRRLRSVEAPTSLFAVQRRSIGIPGRAEAAIDAIRRTLSRLGASSRSNN